MQNDLTLITTLFVDRLVLFFYLQCKQWSNEVWADLRVFSTEFVLLCFQGNKTWVFYSVSIFDALKASLNEVVILELCDKEYFNDVLLFLLVSLYCFSIENLFFFCTGTSLCVEKVFCNFRLTDNLLVTSLGDSYSWKNGTTQQKTMRRIQINPRIVMATMKLVLLVGDLLKVLLSKWDN